MKEERTRETSGKGGRWSVPGYGLLQGLFVSGRNFVESFYKKERCPVIQYPEEKDEISPNFRNFPFLCYDGDDAKEGLRCTACSICEKECPPQCIYIVMDRDENGKGAEAAEGLRHRHIGLHELRDLRGSLSV